MIDVRIMLVTVGPSLIKVAGLDAIALNDLLADAPEPAPQGWGGLRTTTANLLYLAEKLPGATWRDPERRLVEAQAMQLVAAQRRTVPGDYEAAWPFKMPPLAFQLDTFAQARHLTDFALAPVAMGTGKTKMILDIAADKFMRDEIDCLLVIAPNGVNRQWVVQAIPQHLTDALPRAAAVWKSTRKTPVEVAHAGRTRTLRILTFNVESFSRESSPGYKAAKEFLASGRCMMVVDESSRIKTPKAIRTKMILRLRHLAAVRAILSGTPITRGIEDLYTQYQFLDPNILGMSNYWAFRARYCVTIPAYRGAAMGAVKIVGYRNIGEFVGRIAPVSFVIPKDVLGLPEKRYETREVPLTEAQAKLYRAMRDQLVEDLRAKRVATPANAAVRLLRLQQVLCGRVYERLGDETEVPRDIETNRLDVLREVLEDHDGPAVIWARFTQDIKNIKGLLGDRCVTYDGATTQADRDEAVRRFRDGEVPYFAGNPAAAGTGIDGLQISELAIYYSNAFNAEQRWQSEDRTHRLGMRASALYLDLVAPGTVDGLIIKNLRGKEELAKMITENPDMLLTEE